MIIHNVNISPDGQSFIIDIEIPNTPGYENITISKIAIQDYKNYTVGYPSKPQFELNATQANEYKIDSEKIVSKTINIKDITKISKLKDLGMFFIYIFKEGVPGPELTCGEDLEYEVIGVVNYSNLYNLAFKFLRASAGVCDVESKNALLDIYWKKLAITEALEHKDFPIAIELYEDLIIPALIKGDCFNACTTSTYRNYCKTIRTCY